MIFILNKKITKEKFDKARECYQDYVKTVADIKRNLLAVGGEFHIDCEEELLKTGSRQEDLFGGGYRISTKEVEYMAMSNYKPHLGMTTYEIMDNEVRQKINELTRQYLEL